MSLAARIQKMIEDFPQAHTFRYSDLPISKQEYVTAAKALERLQEKGVIKRLSKGVFYKPTQSVFGELPPEDDEVLRDYLYRDGKRVAYVTGTLLYKQMLLTTQVPRVWKIAAYNRRIFVKRGRVRATPVKSYVPVTDGNYQLLGFLDALKDWRKIPDLDKVSGIQVLKGILKKFTSKEQQQLVQFALAYSPRVGAFLGLLIALAEVSVDAQSLRDNLNPLTSYQLGLAFLPQAKNWNIE